MEHQAFFQAILEHPDDVTARLAFADWLEERGDPLGEFIRTQIALDGPQDDGSRYGQLLCRQQELLALHEEEWRRPVAGLVSHCSFRRGFVDEVTLEARAFLENAEALLKSAPIRLVKLRNVGTEIGRLASLPQLDRLSALDLRGNNLGDAAIEILLGDGRFSRLRRLDLGMNFIEVAGARALATRPAFPRMTSLILDHNPVGDMGVHALANPTWTTELAELVLDFCHVEASGCRYLADSVRVAHLHTLSLNHNDLADSGVRALLKSKHQQMWHRLHLAGNQIGAQGVKALLASKNLGNLRLLELSNNAIASLQKEALRSRFGLETCRF